MGFSLEWKFLWSGGELIGLFEHVSLQSFLGGLFCCDEKNVEVRF